MKKFIALLCALLLVFSLMGCDEKEIKDKDNKKGNEEIKQTEIIIAAAASLTDIMEEIKGLFEAENKGIKITFTFGGSGALMTQIEEGAPVDVFFSAAQKQMNTLSEKGLIDEDTRINEPVNKVVLIMPKSSEKSIAGFEDVIADKVAKIALGDPASVPAGDYAKQIFTYMEVFDEVEKKTVFASDVRQILSWVEIGEVDCGVVYSTDAMVSDKVTVVSEAPEGSHTPVLYSVARIKASVNKDESKKFIDFLFTDKIKTLFEAYGFTYTD